MLTDESALGVKICDSLRDQIIRGVYHQGARLPEQEIAEKLSISRIPFREALRQLEADGFITMMLRRSASGHAWNIQAVHDLFNVRLVLEIMASWPASERVAAGHETLALCNRMQRSARIKGHLMDYSIGNAPGSRIGESRNVDRHV